jgi:hypothetical protein
MFVLYSDGEKEAALHQSFKSDHSSAAWFFIADHRERSALKQANDARLISTAQAGGKSLGRIRNT